jgi:hypothetical protein
MNHRTQRNAIHRFFAAVFLLAVFSGDTFADAIEKLKPEQLKAVRQSIADFRDQRTEVLRNGPFEEHRANLHVHSHWSHDSVGTVEEVVAAARATGTTVLMFNEHPADYYDFFTEGNQGLKEGVLMIPGAEMQGFLAFPTMSLRGLTPSSPQELSDLIRGRNGQIFVSHLEERMDWQIQGVTGVEIYNTHADFKDEKNLLAALKNPFRMMKLAELFREYPQESFAALQNYPSDYLKRWDELCTIAPHTGVSANDAHQNIGLVIRWTEDNKGQLEDALGERLIEMDLSALPDFEILRSDKQPGDVILSMFLDRYENSLRHVGTHLLLKDLSEVSVRECLDAGRAFVAFDWIAESRGFDFSANNATMRYEMGSQLPLSAGLNLKMTAPLPVHWRLIRNGEIISESDGRTYSSEVIRPGNYRCEAWLNVAGEPTLWILSNPIYIVEP